MIADALAGKIDLILTKSISRFARNTVDSIQTIRKLKEKDIEVIFEKENIRTLDPSCELVLTIMASLAQEESRSISQNCTWGQRKRFSDGKYSVAYSNFLGYDKDFKINEKEAEIVKLIFNLFIDGKTYGEIRDELKNRNIKTVTGKDKWEISVIKSIIKNEKYCGDALLQKCYTKDYITKKHVKNNGNIPQTYVEQGHMGIISKELYELAQIEVERREKYRLRNLDIFSGKLICSECGHKYYKCTEKGKNTSWVVYKCDGRGWRGNCNSKSLKIDKVKEQFVVEFNKLIKKEPYLLTTIRGLTVDLLDIENDILERDRFKGKLKEFSNRDNELSKKCIEKVNDEIESLNKIIEIKNLAEIKNFDNDLFLATIETVLIDKDGNIKLNWKVK